jgi:RimJ/RimL family protein N-acetyltransferase
MKIILESETKKGTKFIIRYPEESDLKEMHKYINILSKEKTFISFQGEEISLKQVKDYLDDQIKRIKTKEAIQLLALTNSGIIGISSIDLNEGASRHEGALGISILKELRNKGIGTILFENTLLEAEKNLLDLKIITLSLFGNNSIALRLYRKFGFEEYGRLPKGILHKGKFEDHIYMYKKIK